jgi:hypothetical protein
MHSSRIYTVQYQNIETVIDFVEAHGSNCLMSKADIQDAFHLIPIHPSHHHLLGFHWDNTFYYDARAGIITLQAKLSKPSNDCNSLKVILRFDL